MIGQNEAQILCQQVLKRCGGSPAEVLLSVEDKALTRFANNVIHQNVAERNTSITLRFLEGNRLGTAVTNRLDVDALDRLVESARRNAQASPENPDHPGFAGPAQYTPVKAFDQATADYSPEERARGVAIVCRLAGEKNLNTSGAFSTGSGEITIANTLGLFAYHASTDADFQTVVMGQDSSGRSHATAWRAAWLPVEALGREAIQKAERGSGPRKIEPGPYEVVFDPYVTQDLLQMLDYTGMGAQAVLDGRSWMNDRMGQKAMSSLVNIKDDGTDPAGIPVPFDDEGVPKQRVDIVREGVVGDSVYDRSTAQKAGKVSTGHSVPASLLGFGPVATNLFMSPGDASLEDMIRSTKRGLYITRFWYTRPVHPRDCVVTGMTRDGVFMIENGEIAYPVKNLRFTQSYVQALADVESVGRETRLLSSEFGGLTQSVPALKISQFNFTGSTV